MVQYFFEIFLHYIDTFFLQVIGYAITGTIVYAVVVRGISSRCSVLSLIDCHRYL